MPDTVLAQVPLVSLADQASDPEGFAAALGGSFERFGFAMVADHGIPQDLVDRAWAMTKAFFDLPEDVKRSYFIAGGGGARGYTPFKTEIAKGATHVDLKEFWHVGRELAAGHRFSDLMAANVWPDQPEGFRETFIELFAAFDAAGDKLLSAIAVHLGLAPDWFDHAVKDGNSVLRLLHYPPVTEDAPNVRAGAHEDINLITLLLGAEEAGLELLEKDGEWLPVKPPEGALVVNVGDMLQRLTNHVLPSTTHRVVNPPVERRGHSRYSMPFFLHPAPDFLIKALPQTVTAENPEREPPITAHDYLAERLAEIGLTKK
ncbi:MULTISPECIES: isopenicillin N synthase family oxygenase [unclassified Sphingomonas]|uniref:isopenicillin N synthase family dioxygenase n=1 Tax=unclassified Sphingomonas TaxID=196159 RepID=UPI00215093E8|nr:MULTISPECIES: 2-oxoglutarate and iron-dependent oxygenase domain-containing protein [unclassified Sphingomonas]MCR5869840.1 isopenicillin N synthase family oxygenase [Sphingomonas sp. J344]UUX98459.1 isopenicillin N synthase family oxygenase [Sphingomonas sp. J315]